MIQEIEPFENRVVFSSSRYNTHCQHCFATDSYTSIIICTHTFMAALKKNEYSRTRIFYGRNHLALCFSNLGNNGDCSDWRGRCRGYEITHHLHVAHKGAPFICPILLAASSIFASSCRFHLSAFLLLSLPSVNPVPELGKGCPELRISRTQDEKESELQFSVKLSKGQNHSHCSCTKAFLLQISNHKQ